MKNGKFSKTGLILVGCMLVCVILFLAVGVPNGFFGDGGKAGDLDDENTPGVEEVMSGQSPLFVFDKSDRTRALISAFDEGRIESVEVFYDQNEYSAYKTTDQDEIRTVYKALKNIVVIGENDGENSNAFAQTGRHYVKFYSDEGEEYAYIFKGENVIAYKGDEYAIEGGYNLWTFLQDKCATE